MLLDPAVPDIFYFKQEEGASNVIIFIGNPDVDSHLSSNLNQHRY